MVESQRDESGAGQLGRAFASTRRVLAGVRPEHLGAATPCGAWDVRALIDHVVGSAWWGAGAVTGADVGEDPASGDLLARYDESARVALDAFASPGVMTRRIDLGFGVFSGAELAGMVARDQFTHGWDLARAIGHSTDLDRPLAGQLLVQARAEILDAYRGPEGDALFGPVVEPPAGACPADRLAAFLGRSV
ncbi:TIGR03086 family metal-binding protein [Actinacidiphila rubida]|uniref:TIGR03086 family protein n=1 Tax=Actinacidiphila rubida TaxID=310780 RepID=A0A1H8T5G3_9ACTN|nr:TIGR03086 family metal-binding protein [Actinacidiphila rubida]SEO86132.1 TIGR03086 family protein [Actinacidiphila rubida]